MSPDNPGHVTKFAGPWASTFEATRHHEELLSALNDQHLKLLRMLGHVKDAIRVPPRELYRAFALAGYNANLNQKIHNADPDLKAKWAEEDAEALMALGSDDIDTMRAAKSAGREFPG